MKKLVLLALVLCGSLSLATTASAQEVTTVKSQVISMKAKDRTLTLRGAKAGERVQYFVSPDAKITRNGRAADFRMLRPGDIVTINVNRQMLDNPMGLGTVVSVKAPDAVVTQQQPAPAATPRPAVTTQARTVAPTPAPVAGTQRTELPKTAGSLPLLGLIGAGLLGASASLAGIRHRFYS